MKGSARIWRLRLVWYRVARFWPLVIMGAYLLLLATVAA